MEAASNVASVVAQCEASPPPVRRLSSVKRFSKKHEDFPTGTLRSLIFHAEDRETSRGLIKGNGLAPAIIRIGRKVLIDEDRFFQWIDQQQAARCK